MVFRYAGGVLIRTRMAHPGHVISGASAVTEASQFSPIRQPAEAPTYTTRRHAK
jgi:hypothetical protein